MFINFNEHFKVNPPKYIEVETLLSNLYPQTIFCCLFHTILANLSVLFALGQKVT